MMTSTKTNHTPTAQLEVWAWKEAAYNDIVALPNEAQIPFIHAKVKAITAWIKEQQAIKNKLSSET